MIRRLCIALALLLPLAAYCADIAGVKVPDTVTVAGQALSLNGAALRQRMLFKIYVTALYLPARQTTAAQALTSPGAKRVSMILMRDITAPQLIEALGNGLRRNHSPAELEKLQYGVDALNKIMTMIGEAASGSVITLDFVPASGTQVGLNGTSLGTPIAGGDFYRALMKIWIGDDPVDEGMKKVLLGGG